MQVIRLYLMNRSKKIPVTIITGFLGAGKTTFINSILQKYSDTRFALVENEFGDIAIDTKLIKGMDASQMFELKQGCICCTISDEFELVLQELAERFLDVGHLLIETTGVADPASVIQPFFKDEILKETYQYNGTICLVDGLNFNSQPEQQIAIRQMVIADLILINKSKGFTEGQKGNFKNKIECFNPFAKIEFIEFGNSGENSLNKLNDKKFSEFDFLRPQLSHKHIQSKTISFTRPLNKEEFLRWLSYTLDIYRTEIYRTKGILCFKDEAYELIIHGVGGSFEISEGDLIIEEAKSEVVFIGNLANVNLDF